MGVIEALRGISRMMSSSRHIKVHTYSLLVMNLQDLPFTPSFRLDGRRALIVGAGRGIGAAGACALAGAGAEVTVAARSRD